MKWGGSSVGMLMLFLLYPPSVSSEDVYPQVADPVCYAYGEELTIPYSVHVRDDTVFVNTRPYWPMADRPVPVTPEPSDTTLQIAEGALTPEQVALHLQSLYSFADEYIAGKEFSTFEEGMAARMKAYSLHPSVERVEKPDSFKTTFYYWIRGDPHRHVSTYCLDPPDSLTARKNRLPETHRQFVVRYLRSGQLVYGFYERPYVLLIAADQRASVRQQLERIRAGGDIPASAFPTLQRFYMDVERWTVREHR